MLGGGDSEDLAAQGDALDPLLPAFRRLGLQGGWSADGPPQPTPLVGEAADQIEPALPLDPQLLQERRLLGWNLADFPFRELPSGPLHQFQILGEGHVQATEVRGPGAGHRLSQCLLGDLQQGQPRAPALKRRVPGGFSHLA